MLPLKSHPHVFFFFTAFLSPLTHHLLHKPPPQLHRLLFLPETSFIILPRFLKLSFKLIRQPGWCRSGSFLSWSDNYLLHVWHGQARELSLGPADRYWSETFLDSFRWSCNGRSAVPVVSSKLCPHLRTHAWRGALSRMLSSMTTNCYVGFGFTRAYTTAEQAQTKRLFSVWFALLQKRLLQLFFSFFSVFCLCVLQLDIFYFLMKAWFQHLW